MKQRIHFINRFYAPDMSATSQILTGIAQGLAARGHDVRVTCSRQLYEDARSALPSDERVDGVQVHRVGTTKFGRGALLGRLLDYASFYLGAAIHVLRTAQRGDVIVAKTDPPLLSVILGPVARLRGAHVINWLQDIFPEIAEGVALGGSSARMAWAPLSAVRNMSLRGADQNIAIGQLMASFLKQQGVDPARISVIPNWAADTHVADDTRSVENLKREWGLEGRFVVGYSGNLGRAHEIDTVLDAMERIRALARADRDASRIVFLFVGNGAKRLYLETEVKRRGLENVCLKPYQPLQRLGATLAVADVHLVSLLPQLEGFVVPSKLYGIAAAGRPAIFIGAKDGEVARILDHYDSGRSVATGDSASLAKIITTLSHDRDWGKAMGRRARASFDAAFEKSFAVNAWEDIIHKVLAQPAEMARPATDQSKAIDFAP
ncbi:MAG: glycosyltransferase family 4 protein [Hyphomicrobiaceae bacterium]